MYVNTCKRLIIPLTIFALFLQVYPGTCTTCPRSYLFAYISDCLHRCTLEVAALFPVIHIERIAQALLQSRLRAVHHLRQAFGELTRIILKEFRHHAFAERTENQYRSQGGICEQMSRVRNESISSAEKLLSQWYNVNNTTTTRYQSPLRTVEPLNSLITRGKCVFVQRPAVAVPAQIDSREMRQLLAVSAAGRPLLLLLPAEEAPPRAGVATLAGVLLQIAQGPS